MVMIVGHKFFVSLDILNSSLGVKGRVLVMIRWGAVFMRWWTLLFLVSGAACVQQSKCDDIHSDSDCGGKNSSFTFRHIFPFAIY